MNDKLTEGYEPTQAECGRLVDREVHACATALVEQLLTHEPELLDGFSHTDARVCPECCDILPSDAENNDERDEPAYTCSCCNTSFDIDTVDYESRDIFEYWIVSNWLAEKLEARDEPIHTDFYGLHIWGRCTTGQAILLDEVIVDIARELKR